MSGSGAGSPRALFRKDISALFESEAAGTLPGDDLDAYRLTVLTVCTGNICRSPLMEAVLDHKLATLRDRVPAADGLFRVHSSGLGALVDAPADPTVVKLATLNHIDLSQHRARQFAEVHASRSHLVLTATRDQRDAVIAQVPTAGTRTFTFSEFARLLQFIAEEGSLTSPETPISRPSRLVRQLRRAVHLAQQARSRAGVSAGDDIVDPYQHGDEVHAEVAARIFTTSEQISDLLETTVTAPR